MKEELIIKSKPKSNISENIRTIRTNLEFLLIEEKSDCKVYLVTSTNKGEGKSFVSSNLATSFAQNNKKVLLIDCDMRLGRIHEIFNIPLKEGLSNLIVKYNQKTNLNNYIKETNIENLSIISRGITPPNPSELLSSEKFSKLIDKLRKLYDYIILDSVPTIGLSDALITTKVSDEVIIVSKYGKTNIEALEEAKKKIENVNAKIAGVILNGMPKINNKYYDNSYYSE